jgi:hypothetical protein
MKSKLILIGLLSLLVLGSAACGLAGAPRETVDPQAIFTEAARTVQAQLTQQAMSTLIAQVTQAALQPTPQPVEPTETSQVVVPVENTPTATPLPSATLAPTATPLPTSVPSPTPTPIPCDLAGYIKDVSVSDGTVLPPNAQFTKTWRIQNVGSCMWTTQYDLVLVSGTGMGDITSVPLPGRVNPGERVDLSVDLEAPVKDGHYRGYWMLRNAYGEYFGVGDQGDVSLWVDIQVVTPANRNYAYDFAANYCKASWSSSAGKLNCPGMSTSADGSVVLLDRPALENGRIENELTLWTRPETTNGGWISGIFPAYTVQAGDFFVADVGCLEGNKGCSLTFSLNYRLKNGALGNLGEWREVYDGNLTRIDLDLSPLQGQSVQFILSVTANSKPSQANAFWLVPSIRNTEERRGDENLAAQAARRQLADALGLRMKDVTVKSVEAVKWSNSCLDVNIPGQACSAVIVPGYRVILLAQEVEFEAHTNQDGSLVYWFES